MTPKILLFDLETKPGKAYIWSPWMENIPHQMIIEPTGLLMFAAKWLGSKKIIYSTVHHDGEKQCVQALWDLLEEADIVVGHNAKKFDVKMANLFFQQHGMHPPSSYAVVDTLTNHRATTRDMCNRLDYLGKTYHGEGKVQHSGFSLWLGCMNGDEKAWKTMIRYNKKDVLLLEKEYRRQLPWIKNHPNYGVWFREECCSKCGSQTLQKRGYAYTNAGKFQKYQCTTCGGWSQSRKNLIKTYDILK